MKPEPLETRTGKPVGILYCGDCMEVLKGIKENSIDAVVTDPPYGLQFMGREWDKLWRNSTEADANYVKRTSGQLTSRARKLPDYQATDPQQMQAWHETWARECLRVLKPGAHLVAFGGTRTYHRMACAIEDAGFEIRDCILWLYGSGFPKSHAVDKHIDRMLGAERGRKLVNTDKLNKWKVDNGGQATHWQTTARQAGVMQVEVWDDKPVTDAARQWEGWGTALKPACEPIVLARKPLDSSPIHLTLTPEVLATWEAKRCAHE